MAATYKPPRGMGRTEAIRVWRGHQGAVYDLIWDGERRVWLSAGGDGVVAAWTPGEEHGSAVFQHASPFYAVSKWGDATVGGSSDGSLFTAQGSEVRQFDVHQAPVLAFGTTHSGLRASGDANGLCVLDDGRWPIERATRLSHAVRKNQAHRPPP